MLPLYTTFSSSIESTIRAKLSCIEVRETIPINLRSQYFSVDHTFLVTIDKPNKTKSRLFLTSINGKKYNALLVKDKMYSLKLQFSDNSLYKDTLFIGEIVKKKQWAFYINDVATIAGEYVQNQELSRKLVQCNEILKKSYKHNPEESSCVMELTGYFLFNHISLIKKSCKLLFVPQYSNKTAYYFNYFVEEKKVPQKNHLCSFVVRKTGRADVYELFCRDTGKFVDVLGVVGMKSSRELQRLFENCEEQVIECKYSAYFKSYLPILPPSPGKPL